MFLGKKDLMDIYGDTFPEEDFQPAGLDLRLGSLQKMNNDYNDTGIIDNHKIFPKLVNVNMVDHSVGGVKYKGILMIEPGCSYIATVDREMSIPKGFVQDYFPRSSIFRTGCSLTTAVGDPGYTGALAFKIRNDLNGNFFLRKGERFAQMRMAKVTNSEDEYNGSYQNDKHLKDD